MPVGTCWLNLQEGWLLLTCKAALLAADPAVTADVAADAIGVHPDTATRALAALRADAVAAQRAADPKTTAADVTAQLGYPTRTALTAAQNRRSAATN